MQHSHIVVIGVAASRPAADGVEDRRAVGEPEVERLAPIRAARVEQGVWPVTATLGVGHISLQLRPRDRWPALIGDPDVYYSRADSRRDHTAGSALVRHGVVAERV